MDRPLSFVAGAFSYLLDDDTGRAYLSSLDYFRAESGSFAQYGLEPVFFTTSIPQKAHFGTGLLVAKVGAPRPEPARA